MRWGFTLGLCLVCGCSLDTTPLNANNSVTADHSEESAFARAPSLSQTARSSRFGDASTPDASDPTQVGNGPGTMDASMPQDAAVEPPPKSSNPTPMMMAAATGSAAAAQAGGAGAGGASGISASGSGGAPGMPEGGAAAPTTTKGALIAQLNARADKNGPDSLVMRALIAQLDTPFPANSMSLRLLLGTAITSFGCPQQISSPECAVICDFVGDSCFTCVADQECRGQLVLVCPNALTSCLP